MREKGLKWLSLILFSVLCVSLFAHTRVHASPDTTVFFAPPSIVDATKTSGTFLVQVNVSEVTDLFAWQLDLYWDPTVLNLTSHTVGAATIWHITFGDFLTSVYPGEVSSSKFVIHTLGYCQVGQTILNEYYPGVTGDGWLVTLEFTVVGYGATDLDIATGYPVLTFLLDSNLWDIPMTPENGYFRNLHPGDVDGDHYVGSADAGIVALGYGKWRGDPSYTREADFDDDTYIGSSDAGVLAGAYGTTYP